MQQQTQLHLQQQLQAHNQQEIQYQMQYQMQQDLDKVVTSAISMTEAMANALGVAPVSALACAAGLTPTAESAPLLSRNLATTVGTRKYPLRT